MPHPFGFRLCAHSASRMTLRGKGGVFLLLFSNFQFLFSRWPLAGRVLIPKKRRWGACILPGAAPFAFKGAGFGAWVFLLSLF